MSTTGWTHRVERTRSDVLAAVGDLIADGGMEALTMRRLAERANVAVATLYNQFGDRDGVLVAFVSAALDRLESELGAQPAAAPVDGTRALFDLLDSTISADVAVWKPVFAVVRSGPSVAGLGAVGDRVVEVIAADLGKAEAAEMFVGRVAIDVLARHVFASRVSRLERWASGTIGWDEYRASSRLGLELLIASVLREPHRGAALAASGVLLA